MNIKIKKLNPDLPTPKKESEGACAMDVYASEITQPFKNQVTIKLGFATEIPKGYKGIIVPRSSFTQKGWVMQNSPAQIDSDYRGEWMIKFEAVPLDTNSNNWLVYPEFPYKVGDRVAQIYFEKELEVQFEEVEELSNTVRGTGGFGSTDVIKK